MRTCKKIAQCHLYVTYPFYVCGYDMCKTSCVLQKSVEICTRVKTQNRTTILNSLTTAQLSPCNKAMSLPFR